MRELRCTRAGRDVPARLLAMVGLVGLDVTFSRRVGVVGPEKFERGSTGREALGVFDAVVTYEELS